MWPRLAQLQKRAEEAAQAAQEAAQEAALEAEKEELKAELKAVKEELIAVKEEAKAVKSTFTACTANERKHVSTRNHIKYIAICSWMQYQIHCHMLSGVNV